MHDGLRRSLISAIIFGVALFGVYTLSGTNGRFGLFDLLSGKNQVSESFTLASKPRLELDDVELLSRQNEEMTRLMDAVLPSVVALDTTSEVTVPTVRRGRFGATVYNRRYLQPGEGSGVIFTEEGHVVTNYHVIQRAKEIYVSLHDKRVLPVDVIGANKASDIAILKIITPNGEKFPALRFTNSDELRVGETVFAIGNPFGLSESVTKGIVSAKERRLSDNTAELIQTDTVINPGNSGGPLVNVRGDIVGINAAVYSGEQNTGLWQGVGLAIAANDVRDTIDVILNRKRPVYGYLGVTVLDFGRGSEKQPVKLTDVAADSPAAKAGLKAGDIITHFNATEVENFDQLISLVRRTPVGRKAKFRIVRNNSPMTLDVVIGEYNYEELVARQLRDNETDKNKLKDMHAEAVRKVFSSLGIDVRNLTAKEKETLKNGVYVTGIDPRSPLAAQLAPGDLIHHCDTIELESVIDFATIIENRPKGVESLLFVSRRDPWNEGKLWERLIIARPLPLK